MCSVSNMVKFEQISNSSEVTMKNCSVVIMREDCPLCRKSFKCLTDVWDHIGEVHYKIKQGSEHNAIRNVPKKHRETTSVRRRKKKIRLILKVGNEIMSSISFKRKYLKENIITISSKRNNINNGYYCDTESNYPSNVINNNIKIEKDHEVSRIGISQNQSLTECFSYKSDNTTNSHIDDEKLGLLENCFSMQRSDHGFGDKNQQQRSYIFDIDDKENRFKPVRDNVDTNMNEKLNDSFPCSRNNVNSHYSDPISQNVKLDTKQYPQSNMTQQNIINTGQTCSITLQNNWNKMGNKWEAIEVTPPTKNKRPCNDIDLSKPYCNNIKDNKEYIADDEIQTNFPRIKSTTIPFGNKKEHISNNIYHTNGRMLLWNAIKQMRSMDCYMTEKNTFIKDINNERILTSRV